MRRTGVPLHVTSRMGHLICPMCGSGKLGLRRPTPLSSCDSCGCAFDDVILRTLEQIVTLPDAMGKHACECGHPEMRSLPDETFHCPACRSEVVPPTEPKCTILNHAEEGKQGKPAGNGGERSAE